MRHSHHIWKLHLVQFHQNIASNAAESHVSKWLHVLGQQEPPFAHESQTYLIIIEVKYTAFRILTLNKQISALTISHKFTASIMQCISHSKRTNLKSSTTVVYSLKTLRKL